jgi:hypothetical protein
MRVSWCSIFTKGDHRTNLHEAWYCVVTSVISTLVLACKNYGWGSVSSARSMCTRDLWHVTTYDQQLMLLCCLLL